MSAKGIFTTLLKAFGKFVLFFALVAFVITCCIVLFVTTLSDSMGIVFTNENLELAAKLTMLNAVVISLCFTVIDFVRRRLTVNRPVKKITEATAKIIEGDFSARIKTDVGFSMGGEFREIAESINKMAEELSGIETLRSDFISNVSHEMKTPLAVMSNYGTLLQAPDLDENTRIEYAKAVTDASRRLSEMMTNILKLNRLENQQIYTKFELYDLGEQLCECLLNYESVWESKDIDIETHIDVGVGVCTDAELLTLVWNNLFSNAFKFTDTGGKVTLTLTSDDKYATVKISDSGCGMSQEVGAHIFEKFYQGDISRATQGNGLGLALVKRVIDIVDGEISVESVLGEGSTFTVTIRR